MQNSHLTAGLTVVAIMVACCTASLVRAQGAVETPPVFRAADVLPPQMLTGPQYQVGAQVTNDGLMNHFRITSDFGAFEAHSDAELAKRVQEIAAIGKLKQLEGSAEFGKAVVAAGGQVVEGAEALVTKPVATIGGIFEGAGTLLRRSGDAVFGDPKSRYEDNAVQAVSGVSKKKREFAAEVGVDPYSSNQVLQDALTRVARAAAAGNILASGALAAVGGGAGTFVSVTGGSQTLNDVLRTTPPTDIRRADREKLQKMGINSDLIDVFQANVNFSPTYQMLLVDALDRMGGVAGREVVLKIAIGADSDALCMLRQRQVRMYAAYHQQMQPLERFVAVGNLMIARTRDGRTVVAVPADYLAWTESLNQSVAGAEGPLKAVAGTGARELWLGGTISPLARKTLEAQGWKVYDNNAARMIGPG